MRRSLYRRRMRNLSIRYWNDLRAIRKHTIYIEWDSAKAAYKRARYDLGRRQTVSRKEIISYLNKRRIPPPPPPGPVKVLFPPKSNATMVLPDPWIWKVDPLIPLDERPHDPLDFGHGQVTINVIVHKFNKNTMQDDLIPSTAVYHWGGDTAHGWWAMYHLHVRRNFYKGVSPDQVELIRVEIMEDQQ